jgi:hypothetical protein
VRQSNEVEEPKLPKSGMYKRKEGNLLKAGGEGSRGTQLPPKASGVREAYLYEGSSSFINKG